MCSGDTCASLQAQFLASLKTKPSRRGQESALVVADEDNAALLPAAAAAAHDPKHRSRTLKVSRPADQTPADILRECTSAATLHFSQSMKNVGFRPHDFAAILITTLTRSGEPVHAATEEFLNLRESEDLRLLLQKWRAQPQSLTPAGSMSTRQHGTILILRFWYHCECGTDDRMCSGGMEFVNVQRVSIADQQVMYTAPCVIGQAFDGPLASVSAYASHSHGCHLSTVCCYSLL